MINAKRNRRMKVLTVLGVSIAVGALLLMATLPTVGAFSLRFQSSVAVPSDPECRVGSEPTLPAYDPVNHDIYVPNFNSGNVTVLSGSCKVVGTISLSGSAEPEQAAFDPRFNYIDVTDYFQDKVYEISGTSIVATFEGFSNPFGIAYDPACLVPVGPPGCMLVANSGNDTLSTLSGASIAVGPDPTEIAYDPFWDTLLVTLASTDTVSVLNAHSFTPVANTIVGATPEGVAFDPQDSEDYVANAGSDNVTVLGGLNGPGGIDGTISGFDLPITVAWDQTSLHIYVGNFGSGDVFEVSGLSIVKKRVVQHGSEIAGLAYDEATGKMFVTGAATDTVYVIS